MECMKAHVCASTRKARIASSASTTAVLVLGLTLTAHAGWRKDANSLAWSNGDKVIWQFNFDPAEGKPFFHPLTAKGDTSLTTARPEDHPWHYGLWFSWKTINEVNYWEQDRQTGKAEGLTKWHVLDIQTKEHGAATIQLEVEYINPSELVDLTELRYIQITAPEGDGRYAIEWRASFTAGPHGAVLGRTPMPGEPGGQVNGGYAGLSLRLAGSPLAVSYLTPFGGVTEFQSNRARPDARALAANLMKDDQAIGGIAILSAPGNLEGASPWYCIQSDQMRFFCSAIRAPAPITSKPQGLMDLH